MSQIDPGGIQARLREARKALGLTQQNLADLLSVHKRTIENYERVRVPPWAELNRIAAVLNRDVAWFLHGDAATPAAPTAGADELFDLLQRVHQEVHELRAGQDGIAQRLARLEAAPTHTAPPRAAGEQ